MKIFKLLVLSLILSSCTWDSSDKDYEVEFVPVDSIETLKRYDPVTQSYWVVYIASFHVDGVNRKMRVYNDKIREVRVYKKLPSETP